MNPLPALYATENGSPPTFLVVIHIIILVSETVASASFIIYMDPLPAVYANPKWVSPTGLVAITSQQVSKHFN